MKKLLKAICLATALVLGLSCGVFAASIELDNPEVDAAERTVVLSGTVEDPAANQQVTIVVLKSSASLSNMTDSDIVYLNQIPVGEGNTFTDSFAIAADKGDMFTAYIGGTEVATVTSKLINLGDAKPGDLNGDGKVSMEDYNLVIANYGQKSSEGDANGDGEVTLIDYNIVIDNYGN